MDKNGRKYYVFEFAAKATTYIRHALAVVTVGNGAPDPIIAHRLQACQPVLLDHRRSLRACQPYGCIPCMPLTPGPVRPACPARLQSVAPLAAGPPWIAAPERAGGAQASCTR